MFADVRAVVGLERLVIAVDALVHQLDEAARRIALEQTIPIPAPDDLEHVPARAAKLALEFLDDLAVAAHGAIEPLQIAVHDEDQVVEFLTRGDGDRAERFRFVRLAVAEEAPDLAAGGIRETAIVQILEEARLIDRLDRTEAHRDRRELPEIRHQPRVRVGRESFAADLLTKLQELTFVDAALEKRARVDARRGSDLGRTRDRRRSPGAARERSD